MHGKSSCEILPCWSCILSYAVAERPVFLRHFHKTNEHILQANLQAIVQTVGDSLVEALFHLHRAAAVQRYLQKNAIVRSMDAKIIPIKLQPSPGMLRDNLKAVD